MTKYDIVTIGDSSEDIFIGLKDLKSERSFKFASGKSMSFELGEKIPINDVQYEIGGSACNTSVGFSRMNYKTAAISALGQDSPGEKILNRLSSESVETNMVVNSSSGSHFSLIFNLGEERTIFVYRTLDDYSILKPKKGLKTKWIYLAPIGQKSEEVFDRLVEFAAEKNVKIAWNPGSLQIEKGAGRYKSLLSNTTILLLNKEEAQKFLKMPVKNNILDMARQLQHHGPKIVVVTSGKEGAYVYDGLRGYKIDALNQKRIDATGAGDSFAVGFVGRMMEKKDDKEVKESEDDGEQIKEALKWGIINSTSVVNQIGAQAGLLSKNQIEEELKKHPRLYVETI